MEENKSCYHFQLRTYEHVLFKQIDATYIIHLKNNGRETSIEEQLANSPPSHLVYLVENQGYKTCPKKLHEYKPSHDLTDAFLQVFRHAHRYILILDDFLHVLKSIHFFNPKIPSCILWIQSTGFSNHTRLYRRNARVIPSTTLLPIISTEISKHTIHSVSLI